MRRWTIRFGFGLVALVAVAVAGAATIYGTPKGDTLRGTAAADRIFGAAGNDKIFGLGGADIIRGGPGTDTISCGAGRDTVYADAKDKVARDCEIIKRTAAPSPPPAPPPPPPPAVGTRTNPVPLGAAFTRPDGWTIKVISSTPDATAAVMAENMFNDPPAAGNQFFIVNVSATYNGTTSASFDGSYRLRAVGASAVSYSTFNNSCGVIPNEVPDSTVFPGGTVTGNECWQIKSSDADSLVMYDDPFLSNGDPVFFALR